MKIDFSIVNFIDDGRATLDEPEAELKFEFFMEIGIKYELENNKVKVE